MPPSAVTAEAVAAAAVAADAAAAARDVKRTGNASYFLGDGDDAGQRRV